MNTKEINKIFEKAKSKVSVCCDEYHGHSAKCLVPIEDKGDEKDVTICMLCETILVMKSLMEDLINEIKEISN